MCALSGEVRGCAHRKRQALSLHSCQPPSAEATPRRHRVSKSLESSTARSRSRNARRPPRARWQLGELGPYPWFASNPALTDPRHALSRGQLSRVRPVGAAVSVVVSPRSVGQGSLPRAPAPPLAPHWALVASVGFPVTPDEAWEEGTAVGCDCGGHGGLRVVCCHREGTELGETTARRNLCAAPGCSGSYRRCRA